MKAGFTLVEIIVVIAIVTLLTAILLPVFATARNKSKEATCLSNLSNIGKAISLYASDYDDYLPYAPSCLTKKVVLRGQSMFDAQTDQVIEKLPDVKTALKPYGASDLLFFCPMDKIDHSMQEEGGHVATWFEDCGSSYSYDDAHALFGRRLTGYPQPSQNFVAADYSPFHGGSEQLSLRNILFADLHVKVATQAAYKEYRNLDPAEK